MDLESRLKEAFNTDSLQEIADRLGRSYQSIDHYIKGRRKIPIDLLEEISNSTKCSIHWLITGEGPKYTMNEGEFIPVVFEEGVEEIIKRLAKEKGVPVSDFVRDLATESLAARGEIAIEAYDRLNYIYIGERDLRLVPVRLWGEIAAGKPIHFFEQHETVYVPEEFIRPGRETFTLRARGDSMIDEGILDGDILVCVKAADIFNGETVVALIDSEAATVKKFYRKGTQIRLEPANKEYRPIVLSSDRVLIQGVVVGILRRK